MEDGLDVAFPVTGGVGGAREARYGTLGALRAEPLRAQPSRSREATLLHNFAQVPSGPTIVSDGRSLETK
jgi:hypothetical protein